MHKIRILKTIIANYIILIIQTVFEFQNSNYHTLYNKKYL